MPVMVGSLEDPMHAPIMIDTVIVSSCVLCVNVNNIIQITCVERLVTTVYNLY